MVAGAIMFQGVPQYQKRATGLF